MIIYVDDANDEVPVFTQQQYNRLGLKETAGIGTSVIVVRATDPDTGESCLICWRHRGKGLVSVLVPGFILTVKLSDPVSRLYIFTL